ncbi:hypothetical protein SVI_1629 [Shewanella violacea DSS12]|uniref:Uncharacterized protein n=1 Tax=Shewanella violacea (strain JCM 10179 / CIP 106290 / LMG 19151 / DSS12) TaxID=637905 RepID=D4ZIV1_SHEVD|nr:hypothetical protein SVI_1629 [Shewanella violacea DSS12]
MLIVYLCCFGFDCNILATFNVENRRLTETYMTKL